VITEIYKALITIARKTISFFALKVQHNLPKAALRLNYELQMTNYEWCELVFCPERTGQKPTFSRPVRAVK